ncbi:MAG: hypothetical protein DMD81_17055 [Candidatus Rokuibacteriota bacterium]|nr:MAG: hypothetical protein DMD81_17055 [Candidatus Rokubacteria bacterium]
MTFEIAGLNSRSALRTLITKKITAIFDGHRPEPVAARIGFVDENGPKGGGAAMKCGITIELPRRPTVHVEHRASTERLAFDGALAALEHRLTRERGRMIAGRRRPKKYYLAKRLLNPDEALPEIAKKPARRRSALKRPA